MEASVGEQEDLTGSKQKRKGAWGDVLPGLCMGETHGSGTLELLESFWGFDVKKKKSLFNTEAAQG